MNTDRIKEIQEETAYPESVSVQQALLKIWNECEQSKSLGADFTKALNDLAASKVGNEPTKKRFKRS